MGNMLLGLIPALLWGIQPVLLTKIGGKSTNKVLGLAIGALLLAGGVVLLRGLPRWTTALVVGGLLSGLTWSVGMIYQVKSFDVIGVAMAMPFSTGTQLVGTALVGVFYFHEWQTIYQYGLGFAALGIIVAGIVMTSYQEKKGEAEGSAQLRRGILMLLLSTVGFISYATTPRIFGLDGWDVVLPQAIGMVAGTLVLGFIGKNPDFLNKKTFQNVFAGLSFAVANLIFIFSNAINGVAVGFTLSQMNVVVSTLSGLIILKESKTSRELKMTLGGLLLVVAGGIMIGLTKLG